MRDSLGWQSRDKARPLSLAGPGQRDAAFFSSGIDFIVLQVGEGREDLDANPLPPHVLDLGQEVADLADTAAIMCGLDLMISSCTAPLHLAGALGVRTWAMIPFAPYFPWLLERTDTPWYPNMRLYRQEQPGTDWSGVVARIAVDLARLVPARRRVNVADNVAGIKCRQRESHTCYLSHRPRQMGTEHHE